MTQQTATVHKSHTDRITDTTTATKTIENLKSNLL